MLTSDDIKQILELYAKEYSNRKIWEKTGFRDNTIRKYISKFIEKVFLLKEEGLDEEQIASRLDCPVEGVYRALKKYEKNQREEIEANIEAEIVPELEIEVSEITNKVDIKKDWDVFRKDLEMEQRKGKIKSEAIESIDNLKYWEASFREERIFDVDFTKRQRAVRKEVEDFVLTKIDEIGSMESLSDLECIWEDISATIDALIEECDKKIIETRKTRKAREIRYSEQLLSKRINIPLFPEFVRDTIKNNFIVKNEAEASVVSDAMFEFAISTDIIGKNSEGKERLWKSFMAIVKDDGKAFLEALSAGYRNRKYPGED